MKGLTPAQIERIRSGSEEILQTTGFRVMDPGLLEAAAAAGAQVDEATRTVRIPPSLLRSLLNRLPARYTIAGSSGREWTVGAGDQHVLAIVTDPWIIDYETGLPRRPRLADIHRHTAIAQRLPEVAALSLMDYPVSDEAGPHSNLRAMERHLLDHDKHINVMAASMESLERWFCAGRILLAGKELRESRLMSVGVAVRSPLTLTSMNARMLAAACEQNLPVVPTVCPMAGTTAPYSLAGTLLLGNTEVVALAALTQILRPGHPFLYALGASRTDMSTGGDQYYTLDKVLWKTAAVQMARAYGMPAAAECGGAMAARYDLQSGAESMLFMLAAQESGADVLAGLGSCANAVTMSGEMMLVQHAWLHAARFLSRGIGAEFGPARQSIRRAGPGGHYLQDELTLELLRSDEFFSDELFDYGDPYADAGDSGRRAASMLERAHLRAEQMVREFRSPHPPEIQEEIRRFFDDECATGHDARRGSS